MITATTQVSPWICRGKIMNKKVGRKYNNVRTVCTKILLQNIVLILNGGINTNMNWNNMEA